MPIHKHKILVALDGEEKSLGTIQYLCTFRPFREHTLVLFNVLNRVPEYYYDLGAEAFGHNIPSRCLAWESGCRKRMAEFMARARTRLIAGGFPPERVEIKIFSRDKGVAWDILDEAKKGYQALVLRRRGVASALLPLTLGSVSGKLIESAVDIPLILAGTRQVTHTLFLAVDGSEGAERAVEFVGNTLRGSGCRFVLGSVLREYPLSHGREDQAAWTEAAQRIEQALDQSETLLLEAGFKGERIVKRRVIGAKSRSGAIVQTAMENECDAIVLGRKGKSRVADFNIGRVPWKVVHGARQITVWMIP